MTISRLDNGSPVAGTSSTSPTYAATANAGELLLLPVWSSADDDAVPTVSGWTNIGSVTGGIGAHNTATGPRTCTLFMRIADGTETIGGAVVVTNPGTGGTGRFTGGHITRWSKTNDEWEVRVVTGADNSAGTGFSVSGNAELDVLPGDIVFVMAAHANTTPTLSSPTQIHQGLSIPGITFSSTAGASTSEQLRNATSTVGDDCRQLDGYKLVVSGTESGVPSVSYTMSATIDGGPALFAVIREKAATPVDVLDWNGDGLSAGAFTTSSAGTGDDAPGSVNGSTMSVEVAGTRPPQIKWTGGNTGYAVWAHTAYAKIAHRFYYKVSSSFGGGHRVALAWSSVAGAPAWMLDINGSGDVYLLNGAGSTLDNSAGGLLDLDVEYRFEIEHNAGAMTVKIFDGENTTPLDTLTASQTSTTIDQFWWGTTFDTSRGNAFGDALKAVANYSASIGPAPSPDNPPDAPTIGLAIPAASAAVLSWSPPVDDGGSAILGYTITPYLSGTTPQTPVDVGVVTDTVVTGLTPGSSYTFKVLAFNVMGDGAESAASNSITAQTLTGTDPRGAFFERTDLKYGSAIGAWEFNQGDAFDVPAAAARVASLGVTIIRYQMWRVPTDLGGTQPMTDMEDAIDAIQGVGATPLIGLPPISSHQWAANVDGTDPWTTAWQELVIETAVAKGVTLFEMGNEPDNYGPPHGAGGVFFSGQNYFDQLWSGVPDLKDYARTTLSTEIFIGGPSWANMYSGNIADIQVWLDNIKAAYLLDGNRDWIPDFVSGHMYLQTPSEHTESAANSRIADWITNVGTLMTYIADEFDGYSDQGYPLVDQMRFSVTEYNDTIENESTVNDSQTWTDFYYDAMFTMFGTLDIFIGIQFTMLSHEGGALDLLNLDGTRQPAYISFRQIISAATGISGGAFTVWNLTDELPVASVTLWTGTEEVPIGSFEIST